MDPNERHSPSFTSWQAKAKQSRTQHDDTRRSRIYQGQETRKGWTHRWIASPSVRNDETQKNQSKRTV
ncbi:MAG: hypothetical protein RRY07_10380 [Bacteroidaceae bacterium]